MLAHHHGQAGVPVSTLETGGARCAAGLRLVIDAETVVLARVLGVALDELVPKTSRGLSAVLRHGRS